MCCFLVIPPAICAILETSSTTLDIQSVIGFEPDYISEERTPNWNKTYLKVRICIYVGSSTATVLRIATNLAMFITTNTGHLTKKYLYVVFYI